MLWTESQTRQQLIRPNHQIQGDIMTIHTQAIGARLRRLFSITALLAAALTIGTMSPRMHQIAHPVLAAGAGANLLMTGHDADFHCVFGSQCHYFKIAVNFVRNGSTLPVLVIDRCNPEDNPFGAGCNEVATAMALAFCGSTTPCSSEPTLVQVDPRSAAFKTTSFVGSSGQRIYSAIIVASDETCGGCDLNEDTTTPDSDAINARKAAFATAFNVGTGIAAFAGACHAEGYGPEAECASNNFYNFLPIVPTGIAVTPPFTFTALGLKLGFVEGQDDNCCATHNSFAIPSASSPLKVAETDSKGFAETLVAIGARICGTQFCGVQPQAGTVVGGTACNLSNTNLPTCNGPVSAGAALNFKLSVICKITGPATQNAPAPTACSGPGGGNLGSSSVSIRSIDTGSGMFPSGTCTTSACPEGGTVSLSGTATMQSQMVTFTFNGTDDDTSGIDTFSLTITGIGSSGPQTYSWTCSNCLEITVQPLPSSSKS
jgi:hypothetical protein